MHPLLTFGHGTAGQDLILDLLRGAGAALVVDVRRFPGSRRHPHVARDELEQWLPAAGIEYRWEQDLGGRRHKPAGEESQDPWWNVAAFRAYAGYTRTPEFGSGLNRLLRDLDATSGSTVIMCSESLWWRCHRRLISDVMVLLRDVPVQHLGHDGRLSEHVPAAGARVSGTELFYDRDQ